MDYWLHRLADDPRPAPEIPEEPTAERAGPGDLDRVYRTLLGLLSLSEIHREALLRRGLDEAAIGGVSYRTLPKAGRAALARELLERFPARLLATVPGFCMREGTRGPYPSFGGAPGLLIPVLDLDGFVVALKVRRDDDDPRYLYVSSSGRGGPSPGAPVHVSRWNESVWNESARVVRITEGELKADVATALSGVLTISVPGVSAWRGALPLLRILKPSTVILAFDADAPSNPHVARAGQATADALAAEGWEVAVESWDPTRAKGIDDALAAGVPILTTIQPAAEPEQPSLDGPEARAGRYRVTPNGLVWSRPTKDGAVEQVLTNFTARIVTDVVEDDGAEARRRFEIEARLNGTHKSFFVAAESFPGMGWATEHLGARAIVYPGLGLRDHARAAVQLLSEEVTERTVYSHSGWRELPAGWAYLHAGGAVGTCGAVPGVEVALPDSLGRLELPTPPEGEELRAAVWASLGLLDVAPAPIAFPLLAAVYRAALGETDFSLHLAGPSGAGKSELAALVQRHFGAGMDARNLPGSWSSTANALEALAFAAKDAVLVVDDFAPTGAAGDADRIHREADRILRAQGNASGRLRMRADGSLRAVRAPRGLIVSTGEDVPRGQSLRARLLVVEVGPIDVDWEALTASQEAAGEGLCARALSGFLRFVAGRYDEVRASLAACLPELRDAAARSGAHRRTPGIVASLAAGVGGFLIFARSAGALSDGQCEELWTNAWKALGEAARRQGEHQAGAEPAQRFVELLRSAIASGRAHVAGPDGNRPDAGEGAWGWRLNIYGTHEPKGDRVGWLEGDALYLDPDAAYAAAQGLGHEIGDRLAVVPQTLRKRLKERGMLCTLGERRQTLTVRRSFEGQRREVLHLAAATVAPRVMDPDEPEPPGPDGELQAVSWSGFASRWSGAGQVSEAYLTRQNRPSTCGFVVAGQVGQVFRKGERP
jgi:hypothetical protein